MPDQIDVLNCETLDKVNYFTISKFLDKTLRLLWPDGITCENVLLFVNDVAPHVINVGNALKAFYDKIDKCYLFSTWSSPCNRSYTLMLTNSYLVLKKYF